MRSIRLLIDGYNLMFQSQLVGRGRGPGWLEKARGRLLLFLNGRLTEAEKVQTTIVFDAAERSEATEVQTVHAIEVLFAAEHDEADDLLEELIRRAPQPKLLKVVSSDQRIRKCARARRAESIDADSFLSELEARPIRDRASRTNAEPSPRKQIESDANGTIESDISLSDSEIDYWLREFRQDGSK